MTPQTKMWMRRVSKPWRLVFVVYALALTLATHWPSLDLGTEAQPAPDKILHMLAFGGFALLLWRTRWLGAAWMVCFVALVWAALDEVTQALPILQRSFSWQDMFASGLGVLLAIAWIWALGPIGGPANRARLSFMAYIADEVLCERRSRLRLVVIVSISAVSAGTVSLPLAWWYGWGVVPLTMVTAVIGAAIGWYGVLRELWHARSLQYAQARPCFACGASCVGVFFDDYGRSRCSACNAPIHLGQWAEPIGLPRRVLIRAAFEPVMVALALIMFVLGWLIFHLWLETTGNDLGAVAVFAGFSGFAALAWRRYQFRLTALYDRQHVQCRCCNHDLRGTPLEGGLGCCGECGTPFVRFPHQPEAVSRRD